MRRFCNSLKIIPNSYRLNRGSLSLNRLLAQAANDGFSRVLVVTTRKGNPSELYFYQNQQDLGVKFVILGLRMREHSRDMPRAPKFRKLALQLEGFADSSFVPSMLERFFLFSNTIHSKVSSSKPQATLVLKIVEAGTSSTIGFYDQQSGQLYLPFITGFFKVTHNSKA